MVFNCALMSPRTVHRAASIMPAGLVADMGFAGQGLPGKRR